MQEYVRHIENRNNQNDIELGVINEGSNNNGGVVNDQINSLHERQMMISLGTARPIIKDSLLEKPFGFYSTYLALSVNDKESVMETEIVEFYKSLAVDLQDKIELKGNENQAQQLAASYLIQSEKDLYNKIEKLNYHIERIVEMHEKEVSRQQTSYQEIIYTQERQIKVLDSE